MATRMKYTRLADGKIFISQNFILGNSLLYVTIHSDTNTYRIFQTNEVIYVGHCNSLRMCKLNAKTILKEIGVNFEEEERLNGAILKPC